MAHHLLKKHPIRSLAVLGAAAVLLKSGGRIGDFHSYTSTSTPRPAAIDFNIDNITFHVTLTKPAYIEADEHKGIIATFPKAEKDYEYLDIRCRVPGDIAENIKDKQFPDLTFFDKLKNPVKPNAIDFRATFTDKSLLKNGKITPQLEIVLAQFFTALQDKATKTHDFER